MNLEKETIVLIGTGNWAVRTGLAALIVAALAFGWFSVRWQFGNMLAGLTSPTEPNAAEVALAARSLAPGDPSAMWLSAVAESEVFSPEQINSAIRGHIETVRLSPYHYFWWLELGRAYEQADKGEQAEKAFLRAVELAPAYTLPRWQMGNFYLRQGNEEKAFQELKRAAENDAVYREQVFSIAWDYFEQDTARLESLMGNSPEIRVGLAKFYASKELPEKSLEKWRSLDTAHQERNRDVGELIAQALFEKRYLKTAVEFVRELEIEMDVKVESVQNPGFEGEVAPGEGPVFFGWNIQPVENVRIVLARGKKKSGNRSLQISFSGYDKAEFNNVYQTIALEPGEVYELSFWLKTEDLMSAGTPKLEILNAADNRIIAASDPMPTGTADWQNISVRFTVPEGSEGVLIRTSRAYCGEQCPLVGTIWYDDFRIGRAAAED